MSEELKKNPMWKPGSISLGTEMAITLKSSNPVWNGVSKFGPCEMWIGEVRNATVTEGRGKDMKVINDYTGEVVFFPSEKLAPQLLAITEGTKTDIEIVIKKEAVETEGTNRVFTRFTATPVGGDTQQTVTDTEVSPLNDVEKKFMTEMKTISSTIDVKRDVFVKAASKYNIDVTRANSLFVLL